MATSALGRFALLTVAGVLGLTAVSTAQTLTKQWDKRFGGNAYDQFTTIRKTVDGGYLLGGYSNSNAGGDKTEASRGTYDYWVVKLDANGTKQWDRTLGGTGEETLYDLVQTADGGYLLCGTSGSGIGGDKTQAARGGDFWLVKLDATGAKLWDKAYGGTGSEYLYTVTPTTDGGYLLGGTSWSGISGDKSQASQGERDFWVIKIDAAGTKQWDKTFGGTGADELYALQQTTDGGYILSGTSTSPISGDKTGANVGQEDYWVVKIDAAGMKQWDTTLGGSGYEILTSLLQTADGGYAVLGSSSSNVSGQKSQPSRGLSDYWLVKLSASGTKQWDATFGGTNVEAGSGLLQTTDGGYLLGGVSASPVSGDRTAASQGSSDYWIVKTDANGTRQWQQAFGGSINDVMYKVLPTAGGFLLAGYTESSISGDVSEPSRGNFDYWLVAVSNSATATRPTTARQQLQVAPNPASSYFTLQVPVQAPRTGLRLSVLDATGRLVHQQTVLTSSPAALRIELSQQPAGLYLLRLDGPNGYLATHRVELQ